MASTMSEHLTSAHLADQPDLTTAAEEEEMPEAETEKQKTNVAVHLTNHAFVSIFRERSVAHGRTHLLSPRSDVRQPNALCPLDAAKFRRIICSTMPVNKQPQAISEKNMGGGQGGLHLGAWVFQRLPGLSASATSIRSSCALGAIIANPKPGSTAPTPTNPGAVLKPGHKRGRRALSCPPLSDSLKKLLRVNRCHHRSAA